jgi:hypothetical protein
MKPLSWAAAANSLAIPAPPLDEPLSTPEWLRRLLEFHQQKRSTRFIDRAKSLRRRGGGAELPYKNDRPIALPVFLGSRREVVSLFDGDAAPSPGAVLFIEPVRGGELTEVRDKTHGRLAGPQRAARRATFLESPGQPRTGPESPRFARLSRVSHGQWSSSRRTACGVVCQCLTEHCSRWCAHWPPRVS